MFRAGNLLRASILAAVAALSFAAGRWSMGGLHLPMTQPFRLSDPSLLPKSTLNTLAYRLREADRAAHLLSDSPVPHCDPNTLYYDPGFMVTPSSLSWQVGRAPKEIAQMLFDAFTHEAGGEDTSTPETAQYSFALVDLIGDNTPEWVYEYRPNGGSNGRAFAIVTHAKGRWVIAAYIFGGFVAMKTEHKFEKLIVYQREEAQYTRIVSEYDPDKQKFVEKSRVTIPNELHEIASGYVDLWNFFWFLAGDRPSCPQGSLAAGGDYVPLYRLSRDGAPVLETVPLRVPKDRLIRQLDVLKGLGKNESWPALTAEDIFSILSRESRIDLGANP